MYCPSMSNLTVIMFKVTLILKIYSIYDTRKNIVSERLPFLKIAVKLNKQWDIWKQSEGLYLTV